MRVCELIEKLQQLDQDAHIQVYGGYCPEFGETYSDLSEVTQEIVSWDRLSDEPIYEVFIK